MAKKYYWLKLVNNFFDKEEIKILESQENGPNYVLFYLKLLLKSVENEGSLRLNALIPYDEKMLAVVTNTNIDIVRAAMTAFKSLELVQLEDNKTIYMNNVKAMIASESPSAERVRRHRNKLDEKTKLLQCNADVTKSNIELELEKDLDIDLDIDLELTHTKKKGGVDNNKKNKFSFPTNNSFFNTFWTLYPKKTKGQKALNWFNENQLDKKTLDIMLNAVDEHMQSEQWQRESGRYIPDCINWLENACWNDKLINFFKPVQIEPEIDNALDDLYKKIGVRAKS